MTNKWVHFNTARECFLNFHPHHSLFFLPTWSNFAHDENLKGIQTIYNKTITLFKRKKSLGCDGNFFCHKRQSIFYYWFSLHRDFYFAEVCHNKIGFSLPFFCFIWSHIHPLPGRKWKSIFCCSVAGVGIAYLGLITRWTILKFMRYVEFIIITN